MRWPIIACLLLSLTAHAEVYRYTDDKGTTVLSHQGVPPEVVGKGYEVLNSQGRVIRSVAPPPTPEEIRQREENKAQAANDQRLRTLYSNVQDLDIARENKLRTLDAFVTVMAGNLELTLSQQSDLEARAAQQERAGHKLDPETTRQLAQLQQDREQLETELRRRRDLRAQIKKEFDADRARLLKLYPENSAQRR